MTPTEDSNQEAMRQSLVGRLNAAEAALRANLDFNCVNVTARVHMQRTLAHIQEASVAVNGVRRARTVWQLVDDLTKCKRNVDEPQHETPTHHVMRQPL